MLPVPATAMNTLLRAAFAAGVRAVHPEQCLPAHVPAPGPGRTVLIGAGKAAASMAEVFVRYYGAPVHGLVVTRYGHGLPAGREIPGVALSEAAHPVPDAAGEACGARALALLGGLRRDDRVVALLSGGGSALLVRPAAGIRLQDKQALTRRLLAAGATISEINCVRRKLSGIKGGRLAAAAFPAEVVLLAISDVPGDQIADIASGPFSPDPTTLEDAREVLNRYGCAMAPHIERCLSDPANETPKPGDRIFDRVKATLCARSADAVAAAASVAAAAGFEPVLLDDQVNGPAHALAATHAQLAMRYRAAGRRVALLSGGETTVVVRNPEGRGGRNAEYLLALGLALDGASGTWALAGDTDGIDGTQSNAGAVLGPDSLRRARRIGLDPHACLAGNRSWDFFAGLDDLLVTGPTGTNANDLRIVLVA